MQLNHKLQQEWRGPFRIVARASDVRPDLSLEDPHASNVTFWLDNPRTGQPLASRVHANRLKLYVPREDDDDVEQHPLPSLEEFFGPWKEAIEQEQLQAELEEVEPEAEEPAELPINAPAPGAIWLVRADVAGAAETSECKPSRQTAQPATLRPRPSPRAEPSEDPPARPSSSSLRFAPSPSPPPTAQASSNVTIEHAQTAQQRLERDYFASFGNELGFRTPGAPPSPLASSFAMLDPASGVFRSHQQQPPSVHPYQQYPPMQYNQEQYPPLPPAQYPPYTPYQQYSPYERDGQRGRGRGHGRGRG
ncbi:hypothetical protein JCM3770_002071 [Rhodotorula araucariae]